MTPPLSRREEIEAAVAAYDCANPSAPLPRSAAQLLIAMFPRDDAYQGRVANLRTGELDGRTVRDLLRALVDAGILFQERRRGVTSTYRLLLPQVRR